MGAVIFWYIKLSGDIAENDFNEISAPIADQVYLKISIKNTSFLLHLISSFIWRIYFNVLRMSSLSKIMMKFFWHFLTIFGHIN